jgi:hypothetical protein
MLAAGSACVWSHPWTSREITSAPFGAKSNETLSGGLAWLPSNEQSALLPGGVPTI